MKPLRRSARLNSAESAKGGMRMGSVAMASSNDDEDVDSTTSVEEEEEETFDLAEYQRKDRERKDAMGRRQRERIEKQRREEEEQRKLNPVEPSATSSTFPTATLDSGESVETFDLEDYKRKDIEKHTARQREARKRAESRNAKELEDKAKPAEDVSSDSDSSDEDESDTEDTTEGKKAPGKKPSARKAPAVPYEPVESQFAKQMDLYKNDIPKELFSSQPKPPAPKRQQAQAVSTSSRSTQGTSDKENKSAEKQRETEANGQQLSEKGKKKEFEAVKSSASATRSSKQPNVVVEEDEESDEDEMVLLPPETKIQKAKVPFPARVLAGRESMTSEISPSQNQGSFLTSTPSQKTVGLSQGQRQSIALSPLSSAKEPKMRHLILTQKTHQVSSRLPVGVQPLPLRIETEEDGVMSDPEANRKSASRQAKLLRASQSHSEVQAVGKPRLGRSSRASISQPVKNGTFDVPHGFGSAEPRIKRTPHGPRAATAEEKAAEEDNREEDGVSEEEEDFPDEFPKTVSGSQNENERSFPPAAPTEEETEEVYTSKAQSSIVRTQDRNFTADLPHPAEDAEGASISRKAPQKQQKNEATFPVVAGPSTSPATVELTTEKAPSPRKHAPRPRASKKGKEAPVIMLPTRKTKRNKGPPSTAAVFEEEEEEAPASKAQPSPVRPGERIQSQENLFQLSGESTEGPFTFRQTVQNQQEKNETSPVPAGPSTAPAIADGQNEEEEEEEVAEKPAKRGTRSRALKKRGAPTVTLPTKKSKQGKALFPPEEPEVLGETSPKHATSSKAPKKHDEVPVVKLPTIKSKRDKAKVPPPPVVEEEVEKEIEAPVPATAFANSVRRQEKALPKVSKQRKEAKGKSKQDKVAPPPESEQDEAPASEVSKKRKQKPAAVVPSRKKAKKDKVPPPIPDEVEIEEGNIVSPQTTDAMAKGRPSPSSPPKPSKSKITSASRRLRLESDSDKEEKAPEKPPKVVIRSKASGQRKVAPRITSPAKTSKKAPPPVVSEDEEEEEDEQEKVVATSSKAKSSTTRPQERTLAQPSDDDGERPSTSRQAIEMHQKKRKTSIVVAGPSTSQVSLSNISIPGSHVSRRPSIFQTLRESRAASVQPSTSAAAAAKTTKKKGRGTAAVAPEETPERYVGNHVFGNYHMLKQEDFKEILNAQKPDHGLSSDQVEQMSLKVNHFLEDFFTFHCNETEHFYGFIPFLELKQALIDQCLLKEDCTDDDFLFIIKQNFSKEAWKKGEGILYPSRYDLKQTPDTNDYLYK